MVARITSGASPSGALYYNQEKIDRGQALFLGSSNTLILPGEKFSMDRAESTFAPYLENNRRTKLPTFHVSLNPSPEDRLTDEQLRDIAREYMERMGYGAQPYFVFKHMDIARMHVHVVSLRIDSEGRKLPHDFEARRSMTILRELELKYGLHPAIKGERQPQMGEITKVDYRASDIHRQIASVVRTVLHTYTCPSATELHSLLHLYNVSLEEQVGAIRGQMYKGVIYRATTDEGIHAGIPIKAGSIGRDVGYNMLQRYYRQSQQEIEKSNLLESLREKVSTTLREYPSEEEFVRRLSEDKITALLPRNDKGKIYAATFIDHSTGIVVDGTRLGKAFAAYALEWRFNGEGRNLKQAEQATTHPLASAWDALFDLIDTRAFEEQQIIQKRRRKRKRKYKI